MAPTTRLRSRSSVDHIFDLVGDLDEDQLSNLLHELNSSTESNVPVHEGVEYFEEQRLARGPPKVLRPTPSFLNQPHEPADWPKQKPRAVSGSQWRQSMRVASPPYASIKRNQTEPISPPLTASPPLSPPLSPPKHLDGSSSSSPAGPRRSVTAPVLAMEKGSRVAVGSVPLGRPISPPRQLDEEDEELDDDDYDDETQSPSSDGFTSFSFSLDGGLGPSPATPRRQMPKEEEEEEAGVSPHQSPRQQQAPHKQQQLPRQRPQEQQHQRQPSDFSRINTMHLSSLHLHSFRQENGLAGGAAAEGLPRPRTSTGDASATASTLKPRAFRRISRPVFLSPANITAPDVLAQRLSQCLFEDPEPSFSSSFAASTGFSAPAREVSSGPESSLEAMLKEPVAPRSRGMFGRAEREVPSVGIFEVLSEG
ncbi:hypothetical protein VPNG_07298 [Cytospora leucostoma]|uniref:Uncharacterized protein n=1 Tax=Cytospora leucostoma TaxID=1230097 RepID=A0A423WKE0_9PEZI|nr:hypothetical protein VPNG_07298 [Cytospora leucostoma]